MRAVSSSRISWGLVLLFAVAGPAGSVEAAAVAGQPESRILRLSPELMPGALGLQPVGAGLVAPAVPAPAPRGHEATSVVAPGASDLSTVPEPEAWAVMLVGVGLVAIRLRSRGRRTAATRLQ